MSDLVIDPDDVALVKGGDEHQFTAPAGEVFVAGAYIRLDPSTGKFVKGNATTEAELGDGYFAGNGAPVIGETVTGYKGPCVVELGDALAGLNYGDYVYVSDTDGTFADANPLLDASGDTPEVEEQFPIRAGRVVPGWASTTPKKLLRLAL